MHCLTNVSQMYNQLIIFEFKYSITTKKKINFKINKLIKQEKINLAIHSINIIYK